MRRSHRKTAPEVRGGRVRRKNRSAPTPSYWTAPQAEPVLDREDPGPGYRHLLLQRDVRRFIALLPAWDDLAEGLNAIVLARGEFGTDGWHRRGVVAVCAWERELWREVTPSGFAAHEALFARLGVPARRTDEDYYELRFTEATARAYQLLHILLHELGHHHDRMTTRSRRRPGRGEPYAEAYALEHEATIWRRYLAEFGLD